MPEVKRTIPTAEQLVLRDGESDYRLRHLGV